MYSGKYSSNMFGLAEFSASRFIQNMAENNINSSTNLREIGAELLKEIASEKKDSEEGLPTLSDELLSALHVVFPQTLIHALDLVDRNCVTKVVSSSGRELFQVKGSSGNVYNCLMTSEFCTCPSYTYYVLIKEETLMCKHVLAVHIARGLSCVNERKVSDEDLAQILTSDIAT